MQDFVDYPPGPLSGTSTTLSGYGHGNGLYLVNSSSQNSSAQSGWKAFEKERVCTAYTDAWSVSYLLYNQSGYYKGNAYTMVSGNTYWGEWLEVRLPQPRTLMQYFIDSSPGRKPNSFLVAGSNDGMNWDFIDSQSEFIRFNIPTTPEPYSYYRLIVIATSGSSYNEYGPDTALSICEWSLRGTSTLRPVSMFVFFVQSICRYFNH
jgi:hypothetical protein